MPASSVIGYLHTNWAREQPRALTPDCGRVPVGSRDRQFVTPAAAGVAPAAVAAEASEGRVAFASNVLGRNFWM